MNHVTLYIPGQDKKQACSITFAVPFEDYTGTEIKTH